MHSDDVEDEEIQRIAIEGNGPSVRHTTSEEARILIRKGKTRKAADYEYIVNGILK